MVDNGTCPSASELQSALLGLLADDQFEQIQHHFLSCSTCIETAHSLQAADDFSNGFRMEASRYEALSRPDPQAEELIADLHATGESTFHQVKRRGEVDTSHIRVEAQNLRTPSDQPSKLSGQTLLGNYELHELLGAGGMGRVYKARHLRMDRVVAVKVLPAELMKDAESVARFEREARAAARLNHPNIVTAYDADAAGGVHFLAMEFIDGTDLAKLVRSNGPCNVEQAIGFVIQAAQGLSYAHKSGVIHRDIKPSNLLVDAAGTVKILDMGLARIKVGGDAVQHAELTNTGTLLGTVDYMAPEQAVNTKNADARADIYGLGCTLFYLLTGKALHRGDTVTAKLLAHQTGPIPDLCQAAKHASPELSAVFQKMVARAVRDRHQSMDEVISELQTLQTNSSKASSSVGDDKESPSGVVAKQALPTGAQPPRWRTRNVLIGMGAAGSILVLLSILVLIRSKDGKEVARVRVPDGGTVTVVDPAGTQPAAIVTKKRTSIAPLAAVAPFDAKQARLHQDAWARHLGVAVETTNRLGAPLMLIPPGEFTMGITAEQNAIARKLSEDARLKEEMGWGFMRWQDEETSRHTTLTKPFMLGATEVTMGQFAKFVEATQYVTDAEKFGFGNSHAMTPDEKTTPFMKKLTWRTPGYGGDDDFPVTQVSWNDAVTFCNWLSVQEKLSPCYQQDERNAWSLSPIGNGYRLPTEAEWEFACRAGTTTLFSFGDDPDMLKNYAWYNRNAKNSPQVVGTKIANAFGLYDMHGNVSEFCHDFYQGNDLSRTARLDPLGPSFGTSRVVRSGWCNLNPEFCRATFRSNADEQLRANAHGFRVVRVLPPEQTAP